VTDQVDFDEVWDVLAQSLREIHNKNASTLSFETLYRNAYRLVLKKHGDQLYARVKGLVAEHLQEVAVRDVKPLVPSVVVTGGAMFGNSAAIEKRLGGSRFLEQLKAVWEDHQLCMGMITDVLMYMVRGILWSGSKFGVDRMERIGFIVRTISCLRPMQPGWGCLGSTS
jgi:cullin 3